MTLRLHLLAVILTVAACFGLSACSMDEATRMLYETGRNVCEDASACDTAGD